MTRRPPSSSSASTTPAAPRWPPATSSTSPGTGSRCCRPARSPADQVNPVAVEAMAEEGIDIAASSPKVLTDEAVQESDVVVTMGCGDACPFFPGKRYEDWVLDDPAGQDIEAVRGVRDEIRRRVEVPGRRACNEAGRGPDLPRRLR